MKIFQVYIPGRIVVLLLSEAALLFGCFVLARVILGYDVTLFLEYEGGYEQTAVACGMFIAGLYFRQLYSTVVIKSVFGLLSDVVTTAGGSLLLQALLLYVYPPLSLPQRTMVVGSAVACVLLPLWRIAYAHVTLHTVRSERLLFLGMSDTVLAVARGLEEKPEFGSVCGFIDDLPQGETDARVLGPVSGLRDIIARVHPDRLVVGMHERRNNIPVHDLLHLRFSGLPIEEAATAYERILGRVAVHELNPSHLIYSTELGPNPRLLAIQVVYSVILAAIGVVAVSPLLVIVALLVKLTSPGPVFFRQQRVGLYGKAFTLYKFRSMVVDAEARTGAVWAKKNDPRVTPIGKWLRKLRLDELPQLFNVIQGQMALVGPRPERTEFVRMLSEQIPFYPQRHYVRPGVTGWAQINYKYGETIEDTIIKLEYDLYYLKNLSPALDFYCIFHTLRVMLLAEAGQ